jgi:hypothetical protein
VLARARQNIEKKTGENCYCWQKLLHGFLRAPKSYFSLLAATSFSAWIMAT